MLLFSPRRSCVDEMLDCPLPRKSWLGIYSVLLSLQSQQCEGPSYVSGKLMNGAAYNKPAFSPLNFLLLQAYAIVSSKGGSRTIHHSGRGARYFVMV